MIFRRKPAPSQQLQGYFRAAIEQFRADHDFEALMARWFEFMQARREMK